MQGKSRAKPQRYSAWSLLWLFKERGQELLIRRKELPKQNQRQQITKNFLPPDWRSRGNAAVRVWLRRDQGSPLLSKVLQRRLLAEMKLMLHLSFCSIILWWCFFYDILQFNNVVLILFVFDGLIEFTFTLMDWVASWSLLTSAVLSGPCVYLVCSMSYVFEF